MDLALGFINLTRLIGSFVCFQGEEATFKIGSEYLPVCSGCFGIYLGSFAALCLLPFFAKSSRKLYSVKYGLPPLVPLVIYWIVLNAQAYTGTWIVPGIKEVYAFFGLLFGATISNASYNLARETRYAERISKLGRKFWLLATLWILATLVVSFLYQAEFSFLFSASLAFILGLIGLAGFFALWVVLSLSSYLRESK